MSDVELPRLRPLETSPPAGWYPDPAGLPRLRFWDGSNWTSRLAPTHRGIGGLRAAPPRRWKDPRVDLAYGRNTYATSAARLGVLAAVLAMYVMRFLLADDHGDLPVWLRASYAVAMPFVVVVTLWTAARGLERAGASGLGRLQAWCGLTLGVVTAVALASSVATALAR